MGLLGDKVRGLIVWRCCCGDRMRGLPVCGLAGQRGSFLPRLLRLAWACFGTRWRGLPWCGYSTTQPPAEVLLGPFLVS